MHAPRFPRLLAACCVAAAAMHPLVQAVEIDPLTSGPFAVACTHLAVHEPEDAPMQEYLIASDGWFTPVRYVADLLTHPADAFLVEVPGAGKVEPFPVLAYVLHPTPADNPRPDYRFPYTNCADNIIPHMQRPGEKPLFAEPGRRWPVVIASHGYTAHPIWDLDRWKRLASHGYIVVALFHGDGRWSFDENFPRRPAAVRAVLDRLLADPDFAPAIDEAHIGASGSSFGAYTILTCLGAGDPATGAAPHHDPRLTAGFGLVPYVGGANRFPFGRDFAGLGTMTRPYLALYGGEDGPEVGAAALAQCGGEAALVLLPGEQHNLSQAAWNDVPTWEKLFFDAWLKDDASALALLAGDLHVRGGTDDRVTHRRTAVDAAAAASPPARGQP